MALLASYMLEKSPGETLEDHLDKKIFANAKTETLMAEPRDIEGFGAYLMRYKKALAVEKAATEHM
jgi:hypothetical protein